MVIVEEEPRRSIIVGAGASFSFGLPLAGKLLQDASGRIIELDSRRAEIGRSGFRPDDRDISRDDELSLAVLKSIHPPLTLEVVAQSFREHLVQQNLDDFVRDHPSLTPLVSMLIITSLISSMYRWNDGIWELRPGFKKSGAPSENDWMRRFVGVVRPRLPPKTSSVLFRSTTILC